MRKKIVVLLAFLGVIFLPVLGSVLATGHLPKGYGAFPAQFVQAPPGFSLEYFVAFAVFAAFIGLFLLVPRWFGFRKVVPAKPAPRAAFPWWFWLSIPVVIVFWFLMWARIPLIYSLEHYAFVPLAWGMIAFLDGLVYHRNAGRSLMATKPVLFKVMILISCLSWFLFEYLNFFVLGNWYYPNSELLTDFGNIIWFFLGYSTVLTGMMEWYSLLKTVPVLNARYTQGPTWLPNRPVLISLIVAGLFLAFGMGYWPYPLFWAIWVSLVPALGSVLSLVGKANVLTPLQTGNWTTINLIAIGTLLNGFFWELWNFGSNWFHHSYPTAPGFWMYSVPYVNVIHLFSEMPLLGYWGYLFFGVNCWVLWNLAAYFFGFNDDFEDLFTPVTKV